MESDSNRIALRTILLGRHCYADKYGSPVYSHYYAMLRVRSYPEPCRPTDVPDTGLICDLLWADPDKDRQSWVGFRVEGFVQVKWAG